jgi:hypothetical protein
MIAPSIPHKSNGQNWALGSRLNLQIRHAGIFKQLRQECPEPGVHPLADCFTSYSLKESARNRIPLLYKRLQTLRIEHQFQQVSWLRYFLQVDKGPKESRCGSIGSHNIPVAI